MFQVSGTITEQRALAVARSLVAVRPDDARFAGLRETATPSSGAPRPGHLRHSLAGPVPRLIRTGIRTAGRTLRLGVKKLVLRRDIRRCHGWTCSGVGGLGRTAMKDHRLGKVVRRGRSGWVRDTPVG